MAKNPVLAPIQGSLFGPVPPSAPVSQTAPEASPLLTLPPGSVEAQPKKGERAAASLPSPAPRAGKAQIPAVLTVGELTRQIKDLLELEYPRVCVRGEISGFRGRNPSGHLYFSLKDETACIDVKIWSSVASRLKFQLRDGLSVVIEGSVDVYEPRGRYSLIVQRLEPAGEGALALAFEQLKERLMAEGLIGEGRKRPPREIPILPGRIGVVTSIHGAALRDFLRVLHQRHPHLSVLVRDARVQGEGSAHEVVRALRLLARAGVDVIVVTRGGGSIEDLWTFNDEVVARAIYACPVPVVSAVGHEVDFTIADFVADYRAPTPSAAAEKLAPVLSDLKLSLQMAKSRLRKALERQILADRNRLHRIRLADPRRMLTRYRLELSERTEAIGRSLRRTLRSHREQLRVCQNRLDRQRPQVRLARNRQQLLRLRERLRVATAGTVRSGRGRLFAARIALYRASPQRRVSDESRRLSAREARLCELERRRLGEEQRHFRTLEARLESMSPLKVMARGYSITLRKSDGHVLRTTTDVKVGEDLLIKLAGSGCKTLKDCEQLLARVIDLSQQPDRSDVEDSEV